MISGFYRRCRYSSAGLDSMLWTWPHKLLAKSRTQPEVVEMCFWCRSAGRIPATGRT
jgi:hypothetical protein